MKRQAFTLVELLVVIAIMAILASIAIVAFRSMDVERVSASARQIQSALAGARDRAIYAGSRNTSGIPSQCGVRFTIDANLPGTVSSMSYVAPPPPWSQGTVTLGRADAGNDGVADADTPVRTLRGTGTGWHTLLLAGVLTNGCRIRLPANGGWYTVDVSQLTSTQEILLLNYDYRDQSGFASPPAVVAISIPDYRLELKPVQMPGEQPMALASGVVIDTARSQNIPPHTDYFDIMFSSRGTCTGPTSALGVVHFYVGRREDVLHDPVVAPGDKRIVTLRTATGSVETWPVDVTDADADNTADDPFALANRGR